MRLRDAFEVMVRTIGLLVIFYGVLFLLGAIGRIAGLSNEAPESIATDAIYGITYFLLGCWLMFKPRFIVRMTYGRDENSD